MKLRLGIIGAGNIASAHIQNVLDGKCPNIEIVAVADRKESRRQWAAEKLPDARIFHRGQRPYCRQMLRCGSHRRAALPASHAGHRGVPRRAARHVREARGRLHLTGAGDDRRGRQAPELTFGMMFNQRTNCVYRKMKEMLDAGELGELKRVNWIVTDWYRTQFYYDSGAWRATWAGEGGGVLLNQCPHQLDTRKEFFTKILEVVSVLGGEQSEHV